MFPAVPVKAHLVKPLGAFAFVAPQMSRHQVVGMIGATLLDRDDVVCREGHRVFSGQGEINLLATDVAEHALIAQLLPIGKVTDSAGAAHGPSVAELPARGNRFGQPEPQEPGPGVDHGPDKSQKLILVCPRNRPFWPHSRLSRHHLAVWGDLGFSGRGEKTQA
jgi:hypothetical protein